MAKALPPTDAPSSTQQSAKMQREEKLMADVQLVLHNLFEREKATIKQIVGYLYDVGSVNVIDQRVPCRLLNQPAQAIARYSKPVAKVAAWYWFIRNCPQLLTRWLHYQVRFEPLAPTAATAVVTSEELPATADLPTAKELSPVQVIEPYTTEIKKLRGQVRLLTGALVGTAAILGSAVLWLSQANKPQPTLTKQAPQAAQLNSGRSLTAPAQLVQPKITPTAISQPAANKAQAE